MKLQILGTQFKIVKQEIRLLKISSVLISGSINVQESEIAVPATTWTVTHNLNRYPAGIMAIDTGGNVVWGAIIHNSANQFEINFTASMSGKVKYI